MKKIYLVILSIFVFVAVQKSTQAQLNLINKEALDRSGNNMHIGRVTFSAFSIAPYADWFISGKEKYTPKESEINALKTFKNDFKVIIYGGTWCGDTRNQLPKFAKILEELKFPSQNYEMFFVDNAAERYKQTPDANKYQNSVFRVPTFIIEQNGVELGRIIEEPVETLEEDLLKILKQEAYQPQYALGNLVQETLNKNSDADLTRPAFLAKCKHLMKTHYVLNGLGYVFLAQKNENNAFKVFELNTLLYPEEPNTYDSLGEILLLMGKKKLAKRTYEKVLEIDPNNENAKMMLGKIAL
jgi:thiol-disulfide isomerase/thioredoxin